MSERGKVVASHPGYQAADMKEFEFVPLPGADTGGLGNGLGSESSQDVEGAAVASDAASTERKRDASILGISLEGEGGEMAGANNSPDINTPRWDPQGR